MNPSSCPCSRASRLRRGSAAGPALAAHLPVARVLIESSLPHLDRPFDYSVPAALDAAASPASGSRSSSTARNWPATSWTAPPESDAGHPLVPLHKVVSPVPVLTPAVAELAGRVAARYAGTVSDVLRVAVPPRMAKLEKEFAPDGRLDPALFGPDARSAADVSLRRRLRAAPGPATATAPRSSATSRAGESPRAVLSALQGFGPAAGRGWSPRPWRPSGSPAAAPSWWCPTTGTSTGWRPPCWNSFPPATSPGSPRTTARRPATAASCACSAAPPGSPWAPGPRPTRRCRNLGLVVCWDDGDDLHIEQRSPYAHTREVLLLRAGQEGAACLLAAHARSTETQRLVDVRLGACPWKRNGRSCAARFRGS